MSASYRAVQWNPHKKVYDAVLTGAVLAYVIGFIGMGRLVFGEPNRISDEILIIRALGSAALILLHIILCIGPLSRLDRRFAPLLYNRRHLGVAMFLLALGHAALVTGYYGGFGVRNPLSAVLAGYGSLAPGEWPFEWFGLLALIILFLMAATSHDFWLANLSPRVWKTLHLCVYAAYALIVMHVALGPLRSERGLLFPALMMAGTTLVTVLHIAAALNDRRKRRLLHVDETPAMPWVDAGEVSEIPEDRARIVRLKGRERIAVFRHKGGISAVSNVCAHQGGPLGEGKVVDGCITCPWHGYQYRPCDGQSPPPYTERIPTYVVRIVAGRVMVNPEPLPPGTHVEPAVMAEVERRESR